MTAVLFVLAVIWIGAGAGLILYTDTFRDSYGKMLQNANVRLLAFLPLLIGLLLIGGAFSYSGGLAWPVLFIGLLAIAKGVYLALAPLDQIRKLCEWWFERAGDRTLRLWGIVALLLGATLLSYVF